MPTSVAEMYVPLPIPDELTDEDRVVLSAETRRLVVLHLIAVKASLREAGITIDDRELTRFGAQLYIDGFRTAVFKKAVVNEQARRDQLDLPFGSSGPAH